MFVFPTQSLTRFLLSAAMLIWVSTAHGQPPLSVSLKGALTDGLYAEMQTNQGKILLQLEFERVPLTVSNFVGLAEGTKKSNKPAGVPFYDGLIFHRVIDDFMIQGGDPEGTGRGGPGYTFEDEFHPELKHIGPGILSMANSGPATNGSQFFITHKSTRWLDNKHSVFGRVIEGMDVVNAITQGDQIEKVKIIRIGEAAKAFIGGDEQIASIREQKQEAENQSFTDQYGATIEQLKTEFTGIEFDDNTLGRVVKEAGTGPQVKIGDDIQLLMGIRTLSGRRLTSDRQEQHPQRIRVGRSAIPLGLELGLQQMRAGDKHTLVLPPHLGARYLGSVSQDTWLILELELLSVRTR